jgi:hypothetical protein
MQNFIYARDEIQPIRIKTVHECGKKIGADITKYHNLLLHYGLERLD